MTAPTFARLLGALMLAFVGSGRASAQTASFTPLGNLPSNPLVVPDVLGSYAHGVSADGSVVVGESGLGSAMHWTRNTGLRVLSDLSLVANELLGSYALGVSADGTVVVGSGYRSGSQAFRWTASTGLRGLGHLPGGSKGSYADAVSSDGSIVVGISDSATGSQAFRWTAATGMVGLGTLDPAFPWSHAADVSDDGSVVVGHSSTTGDIYGDAAFRWTAEDGMRKLEGMPSGYTRSIAYGVSADGSVIVGQARNGRPFRWTEGEGVQTLGSMPNGGHLGQAYAVSADGSVIVGSAQSRFGREAFLWTRERGMRSLREILLEQAQWAPLAGWTLAEARAVRVVDAVAHVVGYGKNPTGKQEGFLASFPLSANTTSVLWTEEGGRAMVGRVDAEGAAPDYSPAYGPYEGWTAKLLSVGPDARPRLLWERADGQISLWTMRPDGTLHRNGEFGPYPDWRVHDMCVGNDNRPRIMWRSLSSGRVSIWKMDDEGSRYEKVRDFGPYRDWEAHAFAVGPDDNTRIMWRHTSGRISLWELQEQDPWNSTMFLAPIHDYGPYEGWEAVDLQMGADNLPRIVWRHTSGRISLWTVGPYLIQKDEPNVFSDPD